MKKNKQILSLSPERFFFLRCPSGRYTIIMKGEEKNEREFTKVLPVKIFIVNI